MRTSPPSDHVDEEVRAAQFERLYGTVRLQLRRGQLDAAADAAQELLTGWPESTTAAELMGDVAFARGDQRDALDRYSRAMKLEPANADAKRKFAALMRQGGADAAVVIAQRLAEEMPDSAIGHELMGDALLAKNQVPQALEEYEKAREADPGNPDVERKFATLKLHSSDSERRKQLMASAMENPSALAKKKRVQPLMSAVLSTIFPGFGQMYNEDYIKGLGLFAGAFVLIVLLLGELVITPYYHAMAVRGAKHGVPVGEQIERTREAYNAIGPGGWMLIFLGVLALIAIYVYSAWDAYTVAQRAQREADELGIG